MVTGDDVHAPVSVRYVKAFRPLDARSHCRWGRVHEDRKALYVLKMHQPIRTPCVKVCVVDGQSGNCLGCGRTLGEIARWAKFSDAEREGVMAVLPARIDALKAAGKLS